MDTKLSALRPAAPTDGSLPPSTLLIDAISECVPAIGTQDFTDRFLEVVKLTGAGQVTVFAYEPTKVDCLLSRNFLSDEKGRALATAYIDGSFRHDPLCERAMAMRDNDCTVKRLEDLHAGISAQYYDTFFHGVGFSTKIAVLVAQGPLRMVLNLYFSDNHPIPQDHERTGLFRMAARTLASHYLRLSPFEFSQQLNELSERERQVCIGMLAGKKAEIIADEIGVRPSTVVTYRQRAYQKLGISSRGQLFSICQALSA